MYNRLSIICMILLNVDDFFRPGEQNCKIPDIFSMAFLYLGTQKHSVMYKMYSLL